MCALSWLKRVTHRANKRGSIVILFHKSASDRGGNLYIWPAVGKLGEKRTKNQPKILDWFRKQEGEQRRQPMGGRKGVG